MERVQVIEEKKMVKRLFSKFFGNIFLYGLLYIACMVVFLMFIIFQEESLTSMIIMSLVIGAMNLAFIMLIINSSINNTFNGINTVNVPEQSQGRICGIVNTILITMMIVFTIVDILTFHALFQSKIDTKTYTVISEKTIAEVMFDSINEHKKIVLVEKVADNEYLVTTKVYSLDAIFVMIIILTFNILILAGSAGYADDLLKKHLVT